MKNRAQAGATLIEFSLILVVFLTFLLGIVDFSRMLWTWNAANEATRWGARTSVVCDKGAAAVLKNMKAFLPQLTADNVQIDWYGANGTIDNTCSAANCTAVRVQIKELDYQWIAPVGFSTVARTFRMPGFSTYLPREIMGQDLNSAAVCS